MSIMVTLTLKVKPEHVEAMIGGMKASLPDTRAFEGCEGVDVYLQDDGCTLLLVEYWASRAHQEKYLAWRSEGGGMDAMAALLDAPPAFGFYDPVDV